MLSIRLRFNIILVSGLFFLFFLFHNFHGYKLFVYIQAYTFFGVLNLLPIHPLLVIIAVVLAALFAGTVIWFINWKLWQISINNSRKVHYWIVSIPTGLIFLLAGLVFLIISNRYPVPLEWSGFVSIIIGMSLLFFMFISYKKILIISHLILIGLGLVILFIPLFIPGHSEKVKELKAYFQLASEDLEKKATIWNAIEPDIMLIQAGLAASENNIYRFEEHLDELVDTKMTKQTSNSRVLFEIPGDGHFIIHGSNRVQASSEKLVFSHYKAGTILRSNRAIPYKWSEIGAFHITMKVSKGRYFQLYWGEKPAVEGQGISIPLGFPSESASYEIREKIIRNHFTDKIGYIWLIPSDKNSVVEIESFQIHDRMNAVLKGASLEKGYESINNEIRMSLFTAVPGEFAYNVNIPLHNPQLSFGLGLLKADTIEFEIMVNMDSVFHTSLNNPAYWSDYNLDLSSWSGKKVTIRFITRSRESTVAVWSNPVLYGQRFESPNIVVYLVDCLRADHLGAYGYLRNTSPFFDALSSRGVLFEQAYSNGTTTKHTIPGLFTSNPIPGTGVRHNPDVLPERFPTIAEVLRTMGYSTAAFTTNGNVGPFSGTHQGFSRLFTSKKIAEYQKPDTDETDAEILIGELLSTWIAYSRNRNFFLYIHTMDAHGVYDPPSSYTSFFNTLDSVSVVSKDSMFDPDWIKQPSKEGREALYDGEISYGDVYFGKFLDMLEQKGVIDNTIIIFLADHGEYFGEHRLWGHIPPPYKQGTRIPLLIKGPGIPSGLRIKTKVQQLDLMPTILDLVGITPDSLLQQGQSLLPLLQNVETFPNRTLFVASRYPGEAALHCGPYHILPEKNLIFDTIEDPDESRYLNEFFLDFNLMAGARKLSLRYYQVYAELNRTIAPAGDDALSVDPDTLEELRSLGYLQ